MGLVLEPHLHIVAEVIKAELVIGTVGYIAVIFYTAGIVFHIGKNNADTYTQIRINGSHPIGIPFCKVIVYRYNMNTLPCKAV